mmetsp:Transcript_11962/g.17785  ORF Transcript_11962/g.17785 Transcript_11962/m.17785 type:complete len:765 (-) Transcript_11962:55-2349(-)
MKSNKTMYRRVKQIIDLNNKPILGLINNNYEKKIKIFDIKRENTFLRNSYLNKNFITSVRNFSKSNVALKEKDDELVIKNVEEEIEKKFRASMQGFLEKQPEDIKLFFNEQPIKYVLNRDDKAWKLMFDNDESAMHFLNRMRELYFEALQHYGKRIDTETNVSYKRPYQYLNNKNLLQEFGNFVRDNQAPGMAKYLLTMNQFYGSGKTEFIHSLTIPERVKQLNFEKKLVVKMDMVISLDDYDSLEKSEFEKFLVKQLHKRLFCLIFSELHEDWFDFFYDKELYKKIFKWVTAEDTYTVLAIDEIQVLSEAGYKDKKKPFYFGTNINRTYRLWDELVPYQLIEGVTVALLGKSSKFSLFGFSRERSPTFCAQLFLDLFTREDIRKMIVDIKGLKEQDISEEEVEEIYERSKGNPRAIHHLIRNRKPFIEEIYNKKFDSLYQYFIINSRFLKESSIKLKDLHELLKEPEPIDEEWEQMDIPLFELVSNLGLPYNIEGDFVQVNTPKFIQERINISEEEIKSLLRDQYMEYLSTTTLNLMDLSRFKFLEMSKHNLPNIVHKNLNWKYEASKSFNEKDCTNLIDKMKNETLNHAEVLKVNLKNASFADEFMIVRHIPEDKSEEEFYFLGIQDKYFSSSKLDRKTVINEFNKIAKLNVLQPDVIISSTAAILTTADQNLDTYEFLSLEEGLGYKFDLKAALHYAKGKSNIQTNYLEKVDENFFEGFVLTRKYLSNFYAEHDIKILMKRDKDFEEVYNLKSEDVHKMKE